MLFLTISSENVFFLELRALDQPWKFFFNLRPWFDFRSIVVGIIFCSITITFVKVKLQLFNDTSSVKPGSRKKKLTLTLETGERRSFSPCVLCCKVSPSSFKKKKKRFSRYYLLMFHNIYNLIQQINCRCRFGTFYTPWRHQKTFGFLLFSRVIKWEHWPEMG